MLAKLVIRGTFAFLISQKCEIRRKDLGKLVGMAPRTFENVYILNTKMNEECHLKLMDESWLWHRRLGHITLTI